LQAPTIAPFKQAVERHVVDRKHTSYDLNCEVPHLFRQWRDRAEVEKSSGLPFQWRLRCGSARLVIFPP
jgi:hypothetical protein